MASLRLKIYTALVATMMLLACGSLKKSASKQKPVEKNAPDWAAKNYGYKPTRNIYSDLLHTKLEVSFDWAQKQLFGKATLSFKPYYYPQDSLELDAKGFGIKSVQIVDKKQNKKDAIFTYSGKKLLIKLDKTYQKTDTFQIYIDYIAKPEELKTSAGEAITSDKGLFFITPDSAQPSKPYQIWTQGETESNSCWFPTIDAPNEKTTQEIFITVEDKYKTLSNGELVYSHKNNDGTRTDYWKQTQPHSIYLVMMAVGEFAIVKDKWGKLPVEYYVEPSYEKYARNIFGTTPEMLTFFSNKLKYKYPWAKYSSVIVREYVSGAMENTSATVFMDGLQKTDRELLDDNYENIIAHELFHHWFGDLVTAESWAHLPLNESFATYAEYLWEEYKRGKYAADLTRQGDLNNYLNESTRKQEPLIRYSYKNPDDMFDSHSYSKGGCILHLLRNTVGDSAFFDALTLYLKKNEYKTAEIHHLRHAFEEVTGQDLNWFFDQYFMKAGHAELTVMDTYSGGKLKLIVLQSQDTAFTPVYRFPTTVKIFLSDTVIEKSILVQNAREEFIFPVDEKPKLVLFDPEHLLVGETKHAKTMNEYLVQYEKSGTYFAKYEALDELATYKDSLKVRLMYINALDEPFWKFRDMAVETLASYKGADTTTVLLRLSLVAQNDKNTTVRANAIEAISRKKRPQFENIYKNGLSDSSYAVVGASLLAYLKLKPADADSTLKMFDNETNHEVIEALSEYYSLNFDSAKYEWFVAKLRAIKPESLFYLIQDFGVFLAKSPLSLQNKGAELLLPIAEKSQFEWIRYSAFKSLVMLDLKSKELELNRIKENEKSERLKRIYKNLK